MARPLPWSPSRSTPRSSARRWAKTARPPRLSPHSQSSGRRKRAPRCRTRAQVCSSARQCRNGGVSHRLRRSELRSARGADSSCRTHGSCRSSRHSRPLRPTTKAGLFSTTKKAYAKSSRGSWKSARPSSGRRKPLRRSGTCRPATRWNSRRTARRTSSRRMATAWRTRRRSRARSGCSTAGPGLAPLPAEAPPFSSRCRRPPCGWTSTRSGGSSP
mmetsp:Transcript_30767/g.93039  ORF Transcript_30767/g.93039 Transcript_30767/m.93039 type:complete len:216 (+) Transcript_30767:1775-2422(+)